MEVCNSCGAPIDGIICKQCGSCTLLFKKGNYLFCICERSFIININHITNIQIFKDEKDQLFYLSIDLVYNYTCNTPAIFKTLQEAISYLIKYII